MIKHVILWTLRESFSQDEKANIKCNAKKALESLNGNIEGLINLKVNTNGLESSNADMMLDSTFESFDALKNYQKHPLHQNAANNFVRPFTEKRLCLDYEE